MNRITVTLANEIEEALRRIQGGLIQGRKHDVSFTTTINIVLLAGIIATDEFSNETWKMIRDFLNDQRINLDLEGQTDNYINELK